MRASKHAIILLDRGEKAQYNTSYYLCRWVLSAESGCGLAAALVEHVKPALHAGFSDVLGIKLLWAGKQNVAIGQIERTRVAEMRIMRGQIANTFGFEIKLHRITERLGEKEDCFPVVRPIGTLPEACHLGDVWRQ